MKPPKSELTGSAELLRAVLEGIREEAESLDEQDARAARAEEEEAPPPRSLRPQSIATRARAEKLGLRLIVNPNPEPSSLEEGTADHDIEIDIAELGIE